MNTFLEYVKKQSGKEVHVHKQMR